MVVALALGCAEPPLAPVPVIPPLLAATEAAPLARRLVLRLDRPAALELTLETPAGDRTVRFAEEAASFDVPVLGFPPDATSTVSITVRDPATGAARTLDPLTVQTAPLPLEFPIIDVLAHDPERAEPGYWLVSLDPRAGGGWIVAFDVATASVVWFYDGPIDFGDVRPTGRGTLLGLDGSVTEIDLLGRPIRRWTPPDEVEDPVRDVAIPWAGLHHELFPLADGSMVSLVAAPAFSGAYPKRYDRPVATWPAEIADDVVVWFDADGRVRREVPLSQRLDTHRIGFGSLDETDHGYDWVHANAVVADPAGGFLVSSRHQDAVVKLDDAGELAWILGDPAGWAPAFAPWLLAPTPGTTWPYHQHGPNVGPDGRIVLFDNRSVTHTPYTPEPDEVPASRVVAYDVDQEAMTVTEAWSWAPPGDLLLSPALGNAVWLPETGHVLAAWGFLAGEGDARNRDVGRGVRHARLIELDPDDPAPVVDLRLWTDRAVAPEGVKVYRVAHLPSLYGPLAR